MPSRTAWRATRERTGRPRPSTWPPWKKSRLINPATTLKVSVRPAPTSPNRPVTWPAKTDSELFLTIAALRPHEVLFLPVDGLREVAPDHGLDDAVAVEAGLGVGHHMAAVAQHGDA